MFGQMGGREWHAPLFVDRGFKKASYLGPGTDVVGRLRAGIKPISGSDKVALTHDLRYSLANGDVAAERKADQKMIEKLKEKGLDNRFNRAVGSIPIKAKVWLEDKGLLPRGRMSRGDTLGEEDEGLVRAHLGDLEMEGFGRPGHKLRQLARQQGCGNYPAPPPDLPNQVPQASIDQIKQVAISLGVPERINEWIVKQNHYLWLVSHGVPEDPALQEAFGDERPWKSIISRGPARDVQNEMEDVAPEGLSRIDRQEIGLVGNPTRENTLIPAAPRKRKRKSTVGKAEFLARMAKGRAAAKRKRTTKKSTKRRKIPAARRRKMTTKLRTLFKRYGRGLVLAGTGSPDTFDIPEDMSFDDLPKHVGGALKSLYNIEAPPEFMASLGEVLSGTGKEDMWDTLEEQLSGIKQV